MLRNVVAACALLATAAAGQTSLSTSASSATSAAPDELAQVRLRYAASIRQGYERDTGPGLSYTGVTPNDLALSVWLWLPPFDRLGLTGTVQREAFSLNDAQMLVTSGGLIRANVGPTGRVRFGPVRLELAAEYAFHQLPVFGTLNPRFTAANRHGALLAARALVDLGPVTIEARGEGLLGTVNVNGATFASQGYGVGGAIRVQLVHTGPIEWGLLADVTWQRDHLQGVDLSAAQAVVRAGGGIDLRWKEARATVESSRSALRVVVHGPLSAMVTAGERGLSGSTVRFDDLPAGDIDVSATAPGFEPASQRVTVRPGITDELELTLQPEAPRVGALSITVVSLETKKPMEAAIEVAGQSMRTSKEGTVTVNGLEPGGVSVKASAAGYNAGDEAVSIVAGVTSEVIITLVPEKKRIPATLSGQVRSARGGKPVAAQLEIRELKQTITADANGAFSVMIPSGKYSVRIFASGFVTQSKSVTVRDGDQAIFNVDLAPK